MNQLFQNQLVHKTIRRAREDVRVINLSLDSPMRANYQLFERYDAADQHIRGEPEASLPALIEEVRSLVKGHHRRRFEQRRATLDERFKQRLARDREQAAFAWDASPVTTARLCMELYHAIKDEDWVLSSYNAGVSLWPQRLWNIDKPHQSCMSAGAGGLGDGMARAMGAALFHRNSGRIIVNIQADGDLLFTPGSLWTAAHHRLPVLTVVHNNRAYHQEVMHLQVMANQRDRGVLGERIGCTFADPPIDFAQIARGMGVWAEGPVSDPRELGPALQRAVAVVKTGQPALVDVIGEPR